MKSLRVGSRGSELALKQSAWVCQHLEQLIPGLHTLQVPIKTTGDRNHAHLPGESLPVGAFTSTIEEALLQHEIDIAVHSCKDLPTAITTGLQLAAIPKREEAHDVLITRETVHFDRLPDGFTIGTSSPRRKAQWRALGNLTVVPMRGNVPTRVARVQKNVVDGVVLAAAGINRLGLPVPHMIPLPTDRFVPAPAQGALAIQTRELDEAQACAAVLDHPMSRRQVEAERSFLAALHAGCQTPVAALARATEHEITLLGQLFSADGMHCVTGTETGSEPIDTGRRLAQRLKAELEKRC